MTTLPDPDRRAPAPLDALDRWWVVYDGACRVCSALVDRLDALDSGNDFRSVPFQDDAVRDTLDFIPRQAFEDALQLVAPDGRNWEGATAVEVLVAKLPATGWAAPLFEVPGVRSLARKGYRAFARNRHRLGCGEHCALEG
jgi:predicted DCC family thiol-disulfide oxidoreductase YuxK